MDVDKVAGRSISERFWGTALIDIDIASASDAAKSRGRVQLGRANRIPLPRTSDIAVSVPDAVGKILTMAKGKRIRRLRIFGHGLSAGGMLLCRSHGDPIKDETILGWRQQTTGGTSVQVLANETVLAGLRGCFLRHWLVDGWVELHGCQVAVSVAGQWFLRRLADLWDIKVMAGLGDQRTGKQTLNTFEGTVYVADGRNRMVTAKTMLPGQALDAWERLAVDYLIDK